MRDALRRLARDVVRLIRAWWRVDRPRASPHEGRLLRLQARCLIVTASRTVEIVRRRVEETPDGAVVTYHCRGATTTCELRVGPVASRGRPPLVWIEAGCERALTEEDIDVYERVAVNRDRGP